MWQIDKIINVANQLQHTGRASASTGKRIATAFVFKQTALPAQRPHRPGGGLGSLG